ncbi:Protein PET117 homolog, mitochondrial [Anthophora plagiata]
MSVAAKTTFALCCATSLGTMIYVHYMQEEQRKLLHLGVERDIERQEARKRENLYIYEQQQNLAKQLRETHKQNENLETV